MNRAAFEAWYDAQPAGRIQPWDVWQAATAAKDAEISALKAERDAAMKDAERYRYLRGQQHWSEALEKAIDAAIAKAEERTK